MYQDSSAFRNSWKPGQRLICLDVDASIIYNTKQIKKKPTSLSNTRRLARYSMVYAVIKNDIIEEKEYGKYLHLQNVE